MTRNKSPYLRVGCHLFCFCLFQELELAILVTWLLHPSTVSDRGQNNQSNILLEEKQAQEDETFVKGKYKNKGKL